MPTVAISIPRRSHATSATLRLVPVPTPYPPPNPSGMNTYENQGEGGPPRTSSRSLFLALTDFCAGCSFLRSFLPRAISTRGALSFALSCPERFLRGVSERHALLPCTATHLASFQSLPHSLRKHPGCTPQRKALSLDPCKPDKLALLHGIS